jgi:hypothetical protein
MRDDKIAKRPKGTVADNPANRPAPPPPTVWPDVVDADDGEWPPIVFVPPGKPVTE